MHEDENREVFLFFIKEESEEKEEKKKNAPLRNLRIDVYMLLIDSFWYLTCFYSMFDSSSSRVFCCCESSSRLVF